MNQPQSFVPFVDVNTGTPNLQWVQLMAQSGHVSHEAALHQAHMLMMELQGRINAYMSGVFQRQVQQPISVFGGQFMGDPPGAYMNDGAMHGFASPSRSYMFREQVERTNPVTPQFLATREGEETRHLPGGVLVGEDTPFPLSRPFNQDPTSDWVERCTTQYGDPCVIWNEAMIRTKTAFMRDIVTGGTPCLLSDVMTTKDGQLSLHAVLTRFFNDLRENSNTNFMESYVRTFNKWVSQDAPAGIVPLPTEPSPVTSVEGEVNQLWNHWFNCLPGMRDTAPALTHDHRMAVIAMARNTLTPKDAPEPQMSVFNTDNICFPSFAWVLWFSNVNNCSLEKAFSVGVERGKEQSK